MKVVRCPSCRGASRVVAEAIGLMVACPRCSGSFVAVEEAAPVAPSPPPPPPPPPAPAPQLRPRRRDDRPNQSGRSRRTRHTAEPVAPPNTHPTADGHAHIDPVGRLPVSVLIGLALLPFAIPLLWVIAPLVLGQPPMLSLATPIALAVAASALCLAVVYTIDWTPATRVKGVLILVGLSYFAGLSLYFLKKEMVDGVRQVIGPESRMKPFRPPTGDYTVRMPDRVSKVEGQSPLPEWKLTCYRSVHKSLDGQQIVFIVGSGVDPNPARIGDEKQWFDAIKRGLMQSGARDLVETIAPPVGDLPGRQWKFRVGAALPIIRVVRVYRAAGKIYYLSTEGENLDPKDDLPLAFFDSFLVTPKD